MRTQQQRTQLFNSLELDAVKTLSYFDEQANSHKGYRYTFPTAKDMANHLLGTEQSHLFELAKTNYGTLDVFKLIVDILPKPAVLKLFGWLNRMACIGPSNWRLHAAQTICEERMGKWLEYQVMAGK